MPQACSTNYVCNPIWYTEQNNSTVYPDNEDVIAYAAGPHAVDLNVTCDVRSGNVQFQVKDRDGNWFTPAEASYTVTDSNCVRLPRANMPDVRIIATADAAFYVEGSLR
ncbi:virion protein [Roseobacter phage RD-1410Ws-07]|uniref:Virion protein n=2 Tax=Sanyabayvirus DS1410Ws06 TaxID=2844087 RepID=A0A191VYT8_9CAUD|nr:virion structural protein [Dinoroseobacter phage DS-1410Ws-06]ANJ20731.1 virion protein [Dinoroseobacter phage DS-1410Ws-06]ANJ20882.1 virion protein [Roseobacter phage RD-1410Ws-07]